jgi:uncharacterized spore protein YtfJ
MSEEFSGIVTSAVNSLEQGLGLVQRLLTVAKPSAVYSKPVESGDYTVITASEVWAGLGFGYGLGGGSGPTAGESEEPGERAEAEGVGGGGGGGGGAGGRPVATITIGPDGVQVEPVVDATKIALAFFTMLLSIFAMGARMRKDVRKAG